MNKRLNRLREKMKENNYQAVLVTSWQNVFYLSAFTGFGDAFLLITQDKAHIITDSRYTVQAKEEAPDFELILNGVYYFEGIRKIIEEKKIENLAFEDLSIPYLTYKNLLEPLACKLIGLGSLFNDMRAVKDEEEIKIIKEACNIAVEAFNYIVAEIKEGAREEHIAAKLEYKMRELGSSKTSFDTIVASGLRSSMPHGTASSKAIEKGDPITIDFGAFYRGYCSDMTRTLFLKSCDKKMKDIYERVHEANKLAIDSFKIGMTGADLDKIARDHITSKGYGEYFGHGLGHGVGIDVHEEPRISKAGTNVLEKGMIFSIEPGIYIEDLGGVRIEDLALVTDSGIEIITKDANKELLVV